MAKNKLFQNLKDLKLPKYKKITTINPENSTECHFSKIGRAQVSMITQKQRIGTALLCPDFQGLEMLERVLNLVDHQEKLSSI